MFNLEKWEEKQAAAQAALEEIEARNANFDFCFGPGHDATGATGATDAADATPAPANEGSLADDICKAADAAQATVATPAPDKIKIKIKDFSSDIEAAIEAAEVRPIHWCVSDGADLYYHVDLGIYDFDVLDEAEAIAYRLIEDVIGTEDYRIGRDLHLAEIREYSLQYTGYDISEEEEAESLREYSRMITESCRGVAEAIVQHIRDHENMMAALEKQEEKALAALGESDIEAAIQLIEKMAKEVEWTYDDDLGCPFEDILDALDAAQAGADTVGELEGMIDAGALCPCSLLGSPIAFAGSHPTEATCTDGGKAFRAVAWDRTAIMWVAGDGMYWIEARDGLAEIVDREALSSEGVLYG